MITKEQYKYVFKDYLRKYPIGKVGQLSLAEEYSKISIIAYIISREQGLLWEDLVLIMSELRGFNGNRIPMVTVAIKELGVREDFINDYSKIQYLKERNRDIMVGLEKVVISYYNTRCQKCI